MKRKYVAGVMRAADAYAQSKQKADRELVRAWAALLYERGWLDGRLEVKRKKQTGKVVR